MINIISSIRQEKKFSCLFFLILFYTILIRVDEINSSLWNDESKNYLQFIKKGLLQIVWSDSFSPANHILNSILVWCSYKLFGFSEVMLRMPSLIAGITASMILFFFLKSKLGKLEALLFFVFAALCSEHLQLIPQLRGYGLCYLLSVIALMVAYNLISDGKNREQTRKNILIFSIVNFLAIYNFIPFALLSLSLYIIALFYLKEFRRFELLLSAFLLTILCFIAYIPAISNLKNSYKSGFEEVVPRLHFFSFFTIPNRKIISFYFANHIENTTIFVLCFITCSIILILGYYFILKKDRKLANLLAISPTLTLLLGGILKAPLGSAISHPRYTCFLTFYYLTIFSVGLAYLMGITYQKLRDSQKQNEASIKKNLNLFILVTSLCTIPIFQGIRISEDVFLIRGHYKEATNAIEDFQIENYNILLNPSPIWGVNDAKVYFSEKLPQVYYRTHSVAKSGKEEACKILKKMNEKTNIFVVEDIRLEYIPKSTDKTQDYAIVHQSDRQRFKVASWKEKNRLFGVYFFQRGQVQSIDCRG